MPTTKKRINISVTKDVDQALERLAKRDQVPQATKAEHLIRMALEIEEDYMLEKIADSRDTHGVKLVSHEDAWR
jgi:predicted DNA-binding protein